MISFSLTAITGAISAGGAAVAVRPVLGCGPTEPSDPFRDVGRWAQRSFVSSSPRRFRCTKLLCRSYSGKVGEFDLGVLLPSYTTSVVRAEGDLDLVLVVLVGVLCSTLSPKI